MDGGSVAPAGRTTPSTISASTVTNGAEPFAVGRRGAERLPGQKRRVEQQPAVESPIGLPAGDQIRENRSQAGTPPRQTHQALEEARIEEGRLVSRGPGELPAEAIAVGRGGGLDPVPRDRVG